jgi:hypothetical protein
MPRKKKATNTRNKRFQVDIKLHASDIARAGAAVQFKVKDVVGLVGTIEVGQGAFRWKGPYGQKFRRIGWRQFFEKMQNVK